MSKACTKCGEVKSLSAFSKDASRPDGLRNKCRECIRAGDRAYREANLERVREATRDRARHYRVMDAERRAEEPKPVVRKPKRQPMTDEQRREYQREWRRRNPERVRVYRERDKARPRDFLTQWRKAQNA